MTLFADAGFPPAALAILGCGVVAGLALSVGIVWAGIWFVRRGKKPPE